MGVVGLADLPPSLSSRGDQLALSLGCMRAQWDEGSGVAGLVTWARKRRERERERERETERERAMAVVPGFGPLVIFDGDCGFCTSGINWFTRMFVGSFDAVPYQRNDLAELGLTTEQCRAQLQWVANRGSPSVFGAQRSGAQAVTAMLRVGGRERGGAIGVAAWVAGVVASYPPVSWVAAGVYSAIAANRTRLPGGTPACD